MPELTKHDIKEVFVEALEPFAKAIQDDIRGIHKEIDERFNKVDDDIRWIHGSLDLLRQEIADIKEKLGNVVYRHELESLRDRVTRLEERVGLPH